MSFERILLVKPKGRSGLGFASDLIPIGLEYIAASIEGVVKDVRIIDMEFETRSFPYFLTLFRPDLVGLTMHDPTAHYRGLILANIAHRNGIPTVLGGYHPSAIPDELLALPQVDFVVRGEGEETMKELVQKGSPENVLGLSYKEGRQIVHNEDQPLIENLNALSFPARHLRRHRYADRIVYGERRERDVISTSRGCWGRCDFCCEPVMSRNRQRFRSPENVMEELLEIVSFHDEKLLRIFVVDPHFAGDPKRIDRLCDLLCQHNLDIIFSVMTRVDTVARHPQLIEKMCRVGFVNYELGIESPNTRDLRNMRKGITPNTQQKAVRILRENGAKVGGTFVIGLSSQTEEEIKEFPLYAKRIGLTVAAFGIATPFPGTVFFETLRKKGRIVERDWTKYDNMHAVFKPPSMTREHLEELATYCLAKFWTLDTFFEEARFFQEHFRRKISLVDFVEHILAEITFLRSAGSNLHRKSLDNHIKVVLEANAGDDIDVRLRSIEVENIIELARFLQLLGSQIIQCTLRYDGYALNYVAKTTRSSVEYIKSTPRNQMHPSLDVDIDLREILTQKKQTPIASVKAYMRSIELLRGLGVNRNTLRLFIALGADAFFPLMFKKVTRRGQLFSRKISTGMLRKRDKALFMINQLQESIFNWRGMVEALCRKEGKD